MNRLFLALLFLVAAFSAGFLQGQDNPNEPVNLLLLPSAKLERSADVASDQGPRARTRVRVRDATRDGPGALEAGRPRGRDGVGHGAEKYRESRRRSRIFVAGPATPHPRGRRPAYCPGRHTYVRLLHLSWNA